MGDACLAASVYMIAEQSTGMQSRMLEIVRRNCSFFVLVNVSQLRVRTSHCRSQTARLWNDEQDIRLTKP